MPVMDDPARQRGAENPHPQVGIEENKRKAEYSSGAGKAKNRYRQLHQVITYVIMSK